MITIDKYSYMPGNGGGDDGDEPPRSNAPKM